MTGLDLINSSLRLIGVLASGETVSNDEANDALASLNQMLDTWSTQNLLIPAKISESLALVVNQQTYQMGTGAPDFNTARPQKIENINWQQVSGSTTLEIPIEILNQDQWAAISIKTITSNLPTRMWPQYLYPYVKLNFWPIPSVAGNVIVWSWKPLSSIATLTTSLSVPPGYLRALRYNLGIELAPEYGRQLDPVVIENAVESKASIKRMNSPITLLGIDPGVLPKKSTWNWFTGE